MNLKLKSLAAVLALFPVQLHAEFVIPLGAVGTCDCEKLTEKYEWVPSGIPWVKGYVDVDTCEFDYPFCWKWCEKVVANNSIAKYADFQCAGAGPKKLFQKYKDLVKVGQRILLSPDGAVPRQMIWIGPYYIYIDQQTWVVIGMTAGMLLLMLVGAYTGGPIYRTVPIP